MGAGYFTAKLYACIPQNLVASAGHLDGNRVCDDAVLSLGVQRVCMSFQVLRGVAFESGGFDVQTGLMSQLCLFFAVQVSCTAP